MTKWVVDGVLLRSSPTSIVSFDASTPFGCSRRWWYRTVLGLTEPSSPAQEFGSKLHALFEHFLEPVRPKPETTPQMMRAFNSARQILDELKPRVRTVEEAIKLDLCGVELNARMDFTTDKGVGDFKTSSNVERYAKYGASLRSDIQMAIYSHYLQTQNLPWREVCHVTVPSGAKGEARLSQVEMTQRDLDSVMGRVKILLESMKEVARAKSAEAVPPDRAKCGRCPFVDRCPTGGVNIMAMLNLFNTKPPAPASKPSPAPAPAPVLPPDAPPRKMPMVDAAPPPEATAPPPPAPVEVEPAPAPVFEAVPPKRSRGRPPGAKNKPKDEVDVAAEPPAPVPVTGTVKITKVAVSHGLTVNLGKFNSARLDVSLEAEGGEEALAELHAKAKAEVAKQAEEYLKAGGGDAAP